MLEWLPSALPITVGPYGFELVQLDADGVQLKFFGVERGADRAPLVLETGFSFVDDPRFDDCIRAWLTAVREVFAAAAAWSPETSDWLGPVDVCSTQLFENVLAKKSARDEAALLEAWRVQFAGFLPPRPELVEAAAELDAIFTQTGAEFAGIEAFSMHVVGSEEEGFAKISRGAIFLVLRTVTRDAGGSICDIKEQECAFITGGQLTRDRVRAATTAWFETLPSYFRKLGNDVEIHMPHDFISDVLELARPQTKEDFVAALKRRWKLTS